MPLIEEFVLHRTAPDLGMVRISYASLTLSQLSADRTFPVLTLAPTHLLSAAGGSDLLCY